MNRHRLRKAKTLVFLPLVAVLPQLIACQKATVSWRDLERSPQQYSGKTVTLCGWLRMSFEVCGFSEKASKNYGDPGSIWVSPSTEACAESDNSRSREGWYIVSGTYLRGSSSSPKGFGHLGAYEAEISNATMVHSEKGCSEPVRN